VPAWKCGCARTCKLTATRASRATRATHLISIAWLATGSANREGASVLGLVAPDALSFNRLADRVLR